MPVSIISLLTGGAVNPAALGLGVEVNTASSENGEAGFENIMSDLLGREISAEQLQGFFFGARGAELKAMLSSGNNEQAKVLVTQMLTGDAGKKLPADLAMALQEASPEDMMAALQGLVQEEKEAQPVVHSQSLKMLVARLPKRELTPEELSDIVQQTGLQPIVIFTALQNTPMASPNLAAAMVEDMGSAEQDAGLPLPKLTADAAVGAQPRIEVPQTGGVILAPERVLSSASLQAGAPQMQQNVPFEQALKQILSVLGVEQAAADEVVARPLNVMALQNAASPKMPEIATAEAVAETIAAITEDEVAPIQAGRDAITSQPRKGVEAPIAEGEEGRVVDLAQQSSKAQLSKKPVFAPTVAQDKVTLAVAKSAEIAPAAVVNGAAQSDSKDGLLATAEDKITTQPSGAAAIDSTANVRNADAVREPGASSFAHRLASAHGQTPAEQISVRLRQAFKTGQSQLEVRLHPADLGRVSVRIETKEDGQSQVVITADKRETLDMLQKDAKSLERSLQDAGVKTESGSMSFNLRGEQHQRGDQYGQDNRQTPRFDPEIAELLDEKLNTSELAVSYDAEKAYRLSLDWGLDISV